MKALILLNIEQGRAQSGMVNLPVAEREFDSPAEKTDNVLDRGTEAMTIQIELKPEIMERLAAEAQARGVAVEKYAESLLREAMASRSEPNGELSIEEFHAMLNAMAEGSDKLPKVPTSAFTRESFYEDRL